MNLQDRIAKELSDEMCSQIDFEILVDVLCRFGWHKVEFETVGNNKRAIDMHLWCEANCKDQYQHRGRVFVFENQGDAVNFTLKWL